MATGTCYSKSMKAILAVGLPGCGKTTLLKPLADDSGMTYVNADDIREELTGDPRNHTKEPEVWAEVYRRTLEGLKRTGVIIDATFTKRRDRREMIEFCKKHGADDIQCYWVDTPIDTCKSRNDARTNPVPNEVIDKMANRLTLNPPSIEEGYSSIKKISGTA